MIGSQIIFILLIDFSAWILLAVVVGIANASTPLAALYTFLLLISFVAFMILIVKPVLAALAKSRYLLTDSGELSLNVLAIFLLGNVCLPFSFLYCSIYNACRHLHLCMVDTDHRRGRHLWRICHGYSHSKVESVARTLHEVDRGHRSRSPLTSLLCKFGSQVTTLSKYFHHPIIHHHHIEIVITSSSLRHWW